MDKNTELIIKQTIASYNILLEHLKTNNESLILKFIADNHLMNGICYHWLRKYSINYRESYKILKLDESIKFIAPRLNNTANPVSLYAIKEATEKRIEYLKKLL